MIRVTKTHERQKGEHTQVGNRAQRMDGEIGPKALEKRHHEMGGVHALTAHGQQHQRNGHAGDDLQAHLLRRGQAQIPPLDDLDVVIGKTDGAEGQRGKHHQPDEGIGKVAPQQRGQEDGNTDEHAAHGRGAGLFLVALGTVLANVLADLKLAQLLNDERPDEQSDEHRGETGEGSAKRQIPEDAEGSEVGKKFLIQQPVKQTSSATRAKNSSVWGYLTGDRGRVCVCISARTTAATSGLTSDVPTRRAPHISLVFANGAPVSLVWRDRISHS